MVGKFEDGGAGNDTFTVYFNPTNLFSEATIAATSQATLMTSVVSVFAVGEDLEFLDFRQNADSTNVSWDEFIITSTFEDLGFTGTPPASGTPEPSTVALALMGLMSFAFRRRRVW